MDPLIREGQILADKYRIERVLGQGGMGVVVAAHHIQLDERVAIKFLLPEAMQHADVVSRFLREARAAIKIKSEHVARVIDVGTLASGAPYMVMEYLEGADLANWLRTRGPLGIEDAVTLVLQACEALAEAHAIGIIHRDLKPANLFSIRGADGLPAIRVLDFGISKVRNTGSSGAEHAMTSTRAIMGSPLYMSPEQLASARDVDSRTDIWSLGITLYELLTGRVPFEGESFPALCINIVQQAPAPIRNRRPDLPPGLETVILRCLEKDREKRYRTVAEFAVALAEFGPKRARASAEHVVRIISAAGLSASAVALPPSSDDVAAAVAAGTGTAWGQTSRRASGSRRAVLAMVALGTLAAGAAALFLVVRPHSGDDTNGDTRSGAATTAASQAAMVGPSAATTEAFDAALAAPPSNLPVLPLVDPAASVATPPSPSARPNPRKPPVGPAHPPAHEGKPPTPAAPPAKPPGKPPIEDRGANPF